MVTEYNIRNGPVPWKISTCINFILEHILLALTVFEILTFEIFHLEQVGQGHGVQHWQFAARLQTSKSINLILYMFDFRQDLTCANDSYTHTRTHAHTHTRTRTRMRTHKHTHTHARTNARTHAHTHARTHTHTQLHAYGYMQIYRFI